MKHPFNNDDEILEALLSGVPSNVNAALKHLYHNGKLNGAVRKQVNGLGGGENDAQEVLNQALLAFFNQVTDGKYNPALSGITTYIVNIAAQMYYTKRRSEMRRLATYDRSLEAVTIETATNPETEMNVQHRKDLLEKLLAMTGEKCHQALKMQIFSFSMAEIAEKMNYKSADVAKMAIQDCRKKLNKFLAERSGLLDELREL